MSKQRRARVRQFIFAFYMSGIMSMMMSGVITVIRKRHALHKEHAAVCFLD